MFDNDRILAFIPALEDNKKVKNKICYPFWAKPLIAHTIEAALSSKYIDSVIVSTDSKNIADVAKKFNAEVSFFVSSKSINDAILHTLSEFSQNEKIFDDIVILSPTSPLRTTDNIDAAIEKYFKFARKSLLSVSKIKDTPSMVRKIIAEDKSEKLLNTHEDPQDYYKVNNAIYINKISDINEQTNFNDNEIPYIMSAENSIVIDEYQDIELARYWYNMMSLKTKIKKDVETNHVKTTAELLEIIRSYKENIIFSIGNEGNRFLDWLKYKDLIGRFSCIALETSGKFNTIPFFQNNLPKLPLEMLVHTKESAVFFVSVPKNFVQRIENLLLQFGCKKIVFLDDELHQQIQQDLKTMEDSGQIHNFQFAKMMEEFTDLKCQVAEQIKICETHTKTFSQYENAFRGKKVVIVANGPTVNKYKPIPDAIHIGVNRAWLKEDISFDYLFALDNFINQLQDIKIESGFGKIRDKIFLGRYIEDHTHSPFINFPENVFIMKKNILPFYAYANQLSQIIYKDIRYSPLAMYQSTTFPALHFALYTYPKELYLVGCDTTSDGRFYQDNSEGEAAQKRGALGVLKVGYGIMKMFARIHYPETEIISVNPVGLKGLFRDIYTEEENQMSVMSETKNISPDTLNFELDVLGKFFNKKG